VQTNAKPDHQTNPGKFNSIAGYVGQLGLMDFITNLGFGHGTCVICR